MEADQDVLVNDRVQWHENSYVATWSWRRELSARAKVEFEQLINSLNLYVKRDRASDTWVWNLASNGIFTTKKLTRLIDDKLLLDGRSRSQTLKNCLVPTKVEIFIWRMLKRRIPVHTELDKRGIDLDSVRCPLCDDGVESIDYSMIFCRHSMEVWERVYKWWGLGAVANLSINEAFRDLSIPLSVNLVGESPRCFAGDWLCRFSCSLHHHSISSGLLMKQQEFNDFGERKNLMTFQ
ncbi:uncharacterized protein [Rutidosis leptorrhynchoides]|uniref:uncharacterized protein n=1 Tax=Rutidosis leptorrhynchoides TaxID=125765 RepID=UPI003A9A16CD